MAFSAQEHQLLTQHYQQLRITALSMIELLRLLISEENQLDQCAAIADRELLRLVDELWLVQELLATPCVTSQGANTPV